MRRLLFNSTRHKNRLALDSADGRILSSGQHIAVKQGAIWIPGRIEGDGEQYALIPDRGWQARIILRAGMTIQDDSTLEENDPERESEPEPINRVRKQNSNEAMTALYGPAATHSEYSRFTRVRYRAGEASQETAGMIIWIVEESDNGPVEYVIEGDGGGFPDFVSQSNILDVFP